MFWVVGLGFLSPDVHCFVGLGSPWGRDSCVAWGVGVSSCGGLVSVRRRLWDRPPWVEAGLSFGVISDGRELMSFIYNFIFTR